MVKLEIPKHWDKDDPAIRIAWANFDLAVDGRGEYDSLEVALESWHQNAVDTAIADGLGADGWLAVSDAYYALVRHNFPNNN